MFGRKIALITGSSRGIGAAVALRLAADGYDIVINYKEREDKALEVLEAVRGMGRRAIAVRADVSDMAQVEAMFALAKKELGDVSLLVSNAGIAGQKQIQDLTEERWHEFFAVNVDGAFHSVKCAVPAMLSELDGCIIIISSMWGLRGASCESAHGISRPAEGRQAALCE